MPSIISTSTAIHYTMLQPHKTLYIYSLCHWWSHCQSPFTTSCRTFIPLAKEKKIHTVAHISTQLSVAASSSRKNDRRIRLRAQIHWPTNWPTDWLTHPAIHTAATTYIATVKWYVQFAAYSLPKSSIWLIYWLAHIFLHSLIYFLTHLLSYLCTTFTFRCACSALFCQEQCYCCKTVCTSMYHS